MVMTRIKQICFVDEMNKQNCIPVGEPFYRNRVTDEKDIEHVRRMFTGGIGEEYELEVSIFIKVKKKNLAKAEELWMDTGRAGEMHSRLKLLTAREREVLILMLHGLKERQIAEALHFTVANYKYHLTNIYEKLGIHNKYQLMYIAFKENWLSEML